MLVLMGAKEVNNEMMEDGKGSRKERDGRGGGKGIPLSTCLYPQLFAYIILKCFFPLLTKEVKS